MNESADSSDSSHLMGTKLKMPTFAGNSSENITHWLKIFDKWCVLSNFNDAQKPSLLSFVFTGSAAKILAAWDAADAVPTNWNDAKIKITSQFSDSSRKKVYEATLLRRKMLPTENFDEYYADVINLCSLVKHDMTENDKIQNILKGLPEEVVKFLLFKDPQSTDDVLRGYSSFKTAKLLTTTFSENSETASAAPAITESITAALTNKFETLLVSQNEKIAELQALITKSAQDQKCFRCHKPGHLAKDCSLPRTPPSVPRSRNLQSNKDRQDHRPSGRQDFYSRPRTPSPYRHDSRRTPSPHHFSHPERRRTPSPFNRRSSDRYPSDKYYSYDHHDSRENSRNYGYSRNRTPSPHHRRSDYSSSSRYPYYSNTEN